MRKLTFQVYKAADGFRWRAVASNGKIKADGAEAYKRRSGCKKALQDFIDDIDIENYKIVDL